MVSQQFTDANGNYAFANIAVGTYYLHFIAPAGYTLGPAFSGSVTAAVPEDESAGLVGYAPAATGGSAASPASGGNTTAIAISDAGTLTPTTVTTLEAGVFQRTVIVSDPQIVRPTTTAGSVTFTVTISPANTVASTIGYATADGTAVAGTDYTAEAGTLTFAPGVTTQTVTVPILPSTAVQLNKTFDLDITAASGFVNPSLVNPATITNGNFPVASIGSASITRDAISPLAVSVPITLSVPAPFDTSVVVSAVAGTATAPTDFDDASYTVVIPAGATTGAAVFTVLPGTSAQVNRTFSAVLSLPLGVTLDPAASAGTVTIISNVLPTVSVSDATVTHVHQRAEPTGVHGQP